MTDSLILVAFLIAIVFLSGALLAATPWFMKKNECFAVTIPESAKAERALSRLSEALCGGGPRGDPYLRVRACHRFQRPPREDGFGSQRRFIERNPLCGNRRGGNGAPGCIVCPDASLSQKSRGHQEGGGLESRAR